MLHPYVKMLDLGSVDIFWTHSISSVLSDSLLFCVFEVCALPHTSLFPLFLSLALCRTGTDRNHPPLLLTAVRFTFCFTVSSPHGEQELHCLCAICAHMMYCDVLLLRLAPITAATIAGCASVTTNCLKTQSFSFEQHVTISACVCELSFFSCNESHLHRRGTILHQMYAYCLI